MYLHCLLIHKNNASNIRTCLSLDGKKTVDTIVEFSTSGRAPKNDPCLFALAVASTPDFGSLDTSLYALSQLSKVARIGTHLFQFNEFKDGTVVNEQLLRKSKLVRGAVAGIKILGNGEMKPALKIEVDKIAYIEGLKNYIKIHLVNGSRPVLTKLTMKAAEEKLSPDKCIRVHKSFIILLDKITSFRRDSIRIGEKDIPVGKSYRDNFFKRINEKGYK